VQQHWLRFRSILAQMQVEHGVSQYDSHHGWSRYDSLQATITRKVAKGFNVAGRVYMVEDHDEYEQHCNSGNALLQDVHNLKLEKAVALGIHVPHQFK